MVGLVIEHRVEADPAVVTEFVNAVGWALYKEDKQHESGGGRKVPLVLQQAYTRIWEWSAP